jgi:hypothetical protein
VPGSGGDFNIAWEPILVLFTTATAANTRLTTLAHPARLQPVSLIVMQTA